MRLKILSPKQACIPSKSVILILLSAIVVGGVFYQIKSSISIGVHHWRQHFGEGELHVNMLLITNFVLAVFGLFYPVAGFIADIYMGRYRIIVAGFVCFFLACLVLVIAGALQVSQHDIIASYFYGVAVILGIIGISCYQSNIIQFGFDQLLDMPTRYLSMFVHWYVWADSIGGLLVVLIYSLNQQCVLFSSTFKRTMTISMTIIFPIIVITSLCILLRRRMFNTEPVKFNPYKLILFVLRFAWRNKRPVRSPSAFVYCDVNSGPSRLNFSKKRYGGPFPNSDVEDVKTFFRVFCVLLCLFPLFILEVPVSESVSSLLSLHSGTVAFNRDSNCTVEWVILGSGFLSSFCQVIFFPLYIWLIFSVLRNRIPRIFIRMTFSAVLYIVAVSTLLIVDATGHALSHTDNSHTRCMLIDNISPYDHYRIDVYNETLNMHWAVLVAPNFLIGIAPKLLMATSFEFISAQTPHTMKGVMVGILFAIRGLAQLISAILVVPFSIHPWGKYRTALSCSSSYFLLMVIISTVGLASFVYRACKYKYRVRGEEGFSQSQVEEIFDRRLQQEQEYRQLFKYAAIDFNEPVVVGVSPTRAEHYGTIQ